MRKARDEISEFMVLRENINISNLREEEFSVHLQSSKNE